MKLSPRLEYLLDAAAKGAIGSLILGILLLRTNFFIFCIFPTIIAIGIASIVYTKKIKSLESNLFVFLGDLKNLLQGGMNIVTSMEVLSDHDYGALNTYIRRITAQIKIGVPFETSLVEVFSEVDSPMFNKIANVIAETMKHGGNLIKIFSAVANYVKLIDEMGEERRAKTFSTVFSSYFMFFIFIAIILTIQIVFLPMLKSNSIATSGTPIEEIPFNSYFLYLLIIQASFAGPIIGKISEGNAIAGIKHSIILLVISIPIYMIVSMLFIK
ncbi:MAG TPA: type II secretion system F family protein [Candidatus Diapherotrites archaeon]|nr:type II secretion system F family protein [Candidatus Diapherotrites archaeon]